MPTYLLISAAIFAVLFPIMYLMLSYAYHLGMRDGRADTIRNLSHMRRYQ